MNQQQFPKAKDADIDTKTWRKQDFFEEQPLLSQDTSYQYDGGDMMDADAEAMAAASAKSKPPPKIINYAFMDGLRGLGAFAVYLSHMKDQFYPESTQE